MLDLEMERLVDNKSTGSAPRGFGSTDYIKINIFGFALTALWSSLHIIIMPLRLLDFVPETLKNTYLDTLILVGLVVGMIIQPIAGAISDRSGFIWGRRRPYILLGSILILLLLPGVGFCESYATFLLIYCLLQISSNVAQGPFQGFIPDLVPEGKRGLASGVRSLLNIVGGVALIRLVAAFMDKYFAGEGSSWLWLALGTPSIVLLGVVLTTMLAVKEQPWAGRSRLSLLPALYRSFKIDIKARHDFLLFLVACFFVFMAWYILLAHSLYYLMDVVGITRPGEVTGDFLIVVGVCMLVIVYPAGRLSDRLGRRLIAVSSGFLGALGVVALFFSQSYVQVMFSGGLLGICGGAWMSSQWALATDLVGKDEEARYLGLVNMSIAGAGGVSRLIGPVIDFFNAFSPPDLGYFVMLLVCFVFLIVGSLLLMKVREGVNQSKVIL
jgi:Na+/melibiose symporter-like transporter